MVAGRLGHSHWRLLGLLTEQLLVFLAHLLYDLDAHKYLALAEAVREELLDRDLRLVPVEMAQHELVEGFDETIVALGLQLEAALIGNESRNER